MWITQALRVEEEVVLEEEYDDDPESYGSLDGGSPRDFKTDEDDKLKGKENEKEDDDEVGATDNDNDDDDDPTPPRSPNVDIKSAKTAWVSRIVIYQLRITYGVERLGKILEAKVTPNVHPAGYVVSCVLFSKMKDARWRVV